MAYRSRRAQPTADRPESGLVADMVRQFADPYAFLRELVQNGIDAGARRLVVRVARAPDGAGSISVEDDGCGMTRAIIEGPLLTLFSSGKEGDSTKIGRYGVGFVSVFAIEPEVVLVETWREAESWLVRLYPDHNYELVELPARSGSGTAVTLRKPMDDAALADALARTRTALVRWCRHAFVPIVLAGPGVRGDDGERIDRPLDLTAPVSVTERDGEEQFLVAPAPRGESFAGFYNKGLTLLESSEPPRPSLHGIAFKVLSPRLAHTISRDGVRHDEHYHRLILTVERLVREDLPAALGRELEQAAARVAADGDLETEKRYAELCTAVSHAPLELDDHLVPVPLCDALRASGGAERAPATTLKEALRVGEGISLLHARGPTPLTAALAQDGRPVLRLATAEALQALAARAPAAAIEPAAIRWLLFEPVEEHASDRRLCKELARRLEAGGASLASVALARVAAGGAPRVGAVTVLGGKRGTRRLLSRADAERWPKSWLRRAHLLLVVGTEAVARARRLAAADAATAAGLLARLLLLEQWGTLELATTERLLRARAGD
jgi:molecular chaperone HtpG